eukprot:maker-scaffold440_size170678-snap-gene-0.32 protein:Tk09660 transcript:maker-scaffold440_size170678-snap-gene-0.32-mRNA-1 annotation:"low quality protein: transmembrane protein 165-like"
MSKFLLIWATLSGLGVLAADANLQYRQVRDITGEKSSNDIQLPNGHSKVEDDLDSEAAFEDYELQDSFANTSLVYFNSSDYVNETHPTNVTRHHGFLHGFVESLSVILVSELGDKTFFIAAILAMTNNKLTVFLGAISALALMTVLSALLGWVVTSFIPREQNPEAGEESDDPDEGEELQAIPSEDVSNPSDETGGEPKVVKKKKKVQIQENSLFGKRCYKIFKLFLNCFTMTFLAEWGDRSQLATIVLASINDVSGVCVGGVLGHTFCTGLAVIAGALIAKKISVRVVTLIGALVFLGFAVASLFFDPEAEEMIKIDL